MRVPDRAGRCGDGNALHCLVARKQLRIGHGPRCFIGGPRFESLLLRRVHGDVVFATLHNVGVNRLSSAHGNDLIDRFVDPALPIPHKFATEFGDEVAAATRNAVGQPTAITTGCTVASKALLEYGHAHVRRVNLEVVRSPEPRVSAAHNADVDVKVAGQRRASNGNADLVPPERHISVNHRKTLTALLRLLLGRRDLASVNFATELAWPPNLGPDVVRQRGHEQASHQHGVENHAE